MKVFKLNNQEKGLSRPLVVLYYLIIIVSIVRSLVHIFAMDGGAHSIATFIRFEGTPNPNILIYYMFGMWGISQLLLAIVMLVLGYFYPKLIRFMFVVLWLEYAFRLGFSRFIKPLDAVYLDGVAPGSIGNVVFFYGLGALLIYWTAQVLYVRFSKRC